MVIAERVGKDRQALGKKGGGGMGRSRWAPSNVAWGDTYTASSEPSSSRSHKLSSYPRRRERSLAQCATCVRLAAGRSATPGRACRPDCPKRTAGGLQFAHRGGGAIAEAELPPLLAPKLLLLLAGPAAQQRSIPRGIVQELDTLLFYSRS